MAITLTQIRAFLAVKSTGSMHVAADKLLVSQPSRRGSAPDPRDHYWTMWKLPLFGTDDPAAVLAELAACRRANPDSYIKINGYDAARQGQVASFVASQPRRGT